MDIRIIEKSEIDSTIQSQVTELYKQLNADIRQLPLEEILQNNKRVIMAICQTDKAIIGIALLATYKVISGYRGMVEDVVVDKAHRGKGIGRRLMEMLLEEGKNMSLDEIFLFTGHHRTPAINLYKSLGFTLRESGLYNLKLS